MKKNYEISIEDNSEYYRKNLTKEELEDRIIDFIDTGINYFLLLEDIQKYFCKNKKDITGTIDRLKKSKMIRFSEKSDDGNFMIFVNWNKLCF